MGWNDRLGVGPGYQKKFEIYLKSYTDAPDYEDEIYADSKEDALNYWFEKLKKYDWDKEMLAPYIEEIKDNSLEEYLHDDYQEAAATGN